MNTTDTEQTTTTKRTGRLDADARPVAISLAVLLALTALSAMALSFQAHTAVAADRLGAGVLAPAYPIAVDGALVALALAALIQARRGESRWLATGSLGIFTLLSAGVNVTHVLDITAPATPMPAVGVVLGALLPVMVLCLVEVLARVIFSAEPVGAAEVNQVADPAADRPEQITVTRTDTTPIQSGEPAPDQAAEPAAQQGDAPAEPVTAPTPIRRTTTPARKPASKKAKSAPTASLLPEDRVAEAERLIAEATDQGLSAQRAADAVSEQMGLPAGAVSKSRVTRWRRENTAPAAQAA